MIELVERKWQRVARWFLAIAYGIGSPAFAFAEVMTGVFSTRFDYPLEFIYLVSVAQFGCALMLVFRRVQLLSLAVLTVLSVGAMYSHFKIGSPVTALPSTGFTVMQAWYGYSLYRQRQ